MRLAVMSVCVLMLTGCGRVSRQHIDEGMQAIAAQNYEQALTSLEEAETAGEDTRLLYRARGLAYMGLTQYTEAADAFEERKNLAKKYGEEAGTKLLLPMMIMFGIVVAVIMVPAMMSMQ